MQSSPLPKGDMSRINIFGLRATEGFPVCELLEKDYLNDQHVNLIEIARYHFHYHAHRGFIFDGIILVIGSDAGFVYSFK